MKKLVLKTMFFILLLFVSFSYEVKAETLTNIYEIRPTVLCTLPRDNSNNIRAMQGVYFYDHYAIYTGYKSDDKPVILTLVDLNACTVIDKNNEHVLGHANDITYNSKEGIFYVPTNDSNKRVYGFKIINNKIIYTGEPIIGKFTIGGLAYDKEHNRYFSQGGNGKFYTFPSFTATGSNYKEISSFPLTYDNFENGKSTLVRQGMSYANNNIYFARTVSAEKSAYYNDSFVLVFNANTGEYKYSMHFPSSLFNGHLEGITVVGNKIYFGINVNASFSPEPNQTFLVYDGIDKYEKQYNSIVKKTELIKTVDKIVLSENSDFDYSKIKIRKIFNNDSTTTIELNKNNCKITGFNSKKSGVQKVKVTYDGIDYEVDVTVEKLKETKRELLIKKPITIMENGNFDYTNAFIKIEYNNGTKKEIKLDKNNSKISGFDSKKTGTQKVKILYENKTYECDVLVVDKLVIDVNTLDSIKAEGMTDKDKPDIIISSEKYYELFEFLYTYVHPDSLSLILPEAFIGNFEVNKKYYVAFSVKLLDKSINLSKNTILLKLNGNESDYEYKILTNNNEKYVVFMVPFKIESINDDEVIIKEMKPISSIDIVNEEKTSSYNYIMIGTISILIIATCVVIIVRMKKSMDKKKH